MCLIDKAYSHRNQKPPDDHAIVFTSTNKDLQMLDYLESTLHLSEKDIVSSLLWQHTVQYLVQRVGYKTAQYTSLQHTAHRFSVA